MEEIYLPVLSHFQNGNVWTGSGGSLRYKLTPGEDTIAAQVWQGPWCFEESVVEEEASFPLSEEGIAALADWLAAWIGRMNCRPQKSLAETLALRDDLRAERKAQTAQPEA